MIIGQSEMHELPLNVAGKTSIYYQLKLLVSESGEREKSWNLLKKNVFLEFQLLFIRYSVFIKRSKINSIRFNRFISLLTKNMQSGKQET